MPAIPMTRRATLAALGALAVPSAVVRGAHAQGGVRFRDIVVDVAPLRAWVGDPTAAWVEQELPVALAQALAGYMASGDRSGATLVVRIDYIYLAPTSGGSGKPGGFQDTIAGALMIRGRRGGVAVVAPLRAIASYYPMSVDTTLVVEGFHGRVAALVQSFAGWAPRELGLRQRGVAGSSIDFEGRLSKAPRRFVSEGRRRNARDSHDPPSRARRSRGSRASWWRKPERVR